MTRKRLIQTDRLIVAVEIEMVIPESNPSEPCLESETVELLRQVHDHAVEGDGFPGSCTPCRNN